MIEISKTKLRLLASVVRLRVHFDFGYFSNWAFYSEHCKQMRLISDDLSRKKLPESFSNQICPNRIKRFGVMGSSVQNFVNLGSDKKCPPPLAKQAKTSNGEVLL